MCIIQLRSKQRDQLFESFFAGGSEAVLPVNSRSRNTFDQLSWFEVAIRYLTSISRLRFTGCWAVQGNSTDMHKILAPTNSKCNVMYQKLLTFVLTQPVIELKVEMDSIEGNERSNDNGDYVFQIIGIVRGPLAQRMIMTLSGAKDDLQASYITSKDSIPAIMISRRAKSRQR